MKKENTDSKWSLEVVDPQGREWKSLLENSAHLIFHEPEWAAAMNLAGRRTLCAVFFRDGEVRGGFLGFQLGFGICRIGYCNTPYGGFVGERPEGEALLALLREFGGQLGLARLQFVDFPGSGLVPHPSLEGVVDYTDQFQLQDRDAEALEKSYRRQLRQDLKRLRNAGVEVHCQNDAAALKVLHRHYLQTMKVRGGIVRYEYSWLEAVQRSLGARCQVLVAKKGDEDLGAMMIVDSKKCAHGLMLVSDPKGPISSVNKALLDAALRKALARGMDVFDYMPSGKSSPGVSHFKKLFGAERVPLRHENFVVSPLGNLIWKGLYAGAGTPLGKVLLQWKEKLKTS